MAKNKSKGGSTSKINPVRELLRDPHQEEDYMENIEENSRAATATVTEKIPTVPKPADAPVPPGNAAPTMSRPQFNTWVAAYILADAAVQRDASGVYDVLARNFADSGMLSWFLHRIGHGNMAKLGRRKDLFDYLRLVSNALHRQLKRDLGRPVARL